MDAGIMQSASRPFCFLFVLLSAVVVGGSTGVGNDPDKKQAATPHHNSQPSSQPEQQQKQQHQQQQHQQQQQQQHQQQKHQQQQQQEQKPLMPPMERGPSLLDNFDIHPSAADALLFTTTVPGMSGRYQLHMLGSWNGRHVWFKDTTGVIFFSKEGRWTIARRNPAQVVSVQTLRNDAYPNPPVNGWTTGTIVQTAAKLPQGNLFHPAGRWDLNGEEFSVADVGKEGEKFGNGYKVGSHNVLEAANKPPSENSGFVTATWAVPKSGAWLWFTMVDEDTLHVMWDAKVTVAKRMSEHTASGEASEQLVSKILQQLFADHFTKPVLERVTGCRDGAPNKKIQTTSGCPAHKTVPLTVSGENFGKSGAEVYFLNRAGEGNREEGQQVQISCENVRHDIIKPSQTLYCDLPPLEGGVVLDAVVVAKGEVAAGSGEKFESVLYGAVKTEESGGRGAEALRRLNFRDFEELGVGGLGPEFEQMFRRAFASRLQDPKVIEQLGIRHVRGVVLHGPPGTGKTLLARRISELLGASKVHTVSGPEIMNKYVGQSESNLRKIFERATEAAEEDGGLHLIIFDEMDAIMKPRGQGDDTGARQTYDGITTQLLTLMDGLHDKGDLLVLGLTNRLHAVDEALLRPGRFEVQIKMPLPDEKGRHEIFIILTKAARASGYFAQEVDLKKLAKETPSFTGADIEGVIKSATSHALADYQDAVSSQGTEAPSLKITLEHFRRALKEVVPTYGSGRAVNEYLEKGIIHHSDGFTKLLQSFDRPIHRIRYGKRSKMLKILIEGDPGAGTTSVASYVAKRSGFPYVHLLTIDDFIGFTQGEELKKIRETFENAYQVDRSCIILDRLEAIMEYGGSGQVSSGVQHMLQQLLGKKPVGKGKVLVLATTSSADSLRYLGFGQWDMYATVPNLDKKGMETVFNELHVFETPAVTKEVLKKMPVSIGIKKLLWLVEEARVVAGIDEDVHLEAKVKQEKEKKHPFTEGKMQFVVPAASAPSPSEAPVHGTPLLFTELGLEEGWHEEPTISPEARRKAAAEQKRKEKLAKRAARGEEEEIDYEELHGTEEEEEVAEAAGHPQEALTAKGYLHPDVFLALLDETGMQSSDGGLPTAKGTLIL